jgi:hypothetical protein
VGDSRALELRYLAVGLRGSDLKAVKNAMLLRCVRLAWVCEAPMVRSSAGPLRRPRLDLDSRITSLIERETVKLKFKLPSETLDDHIKNYDRCTLARQGLDPSGLINPVKEPDSHILRKPTRSKRHRDNSSVPRWF